MFSIFLELETFERKKELDLYIRRQIDSCCTIASDVRKVKVARYAKIYNKIYENLVIIILPFTS